MVLFLVPTALLMVGLLVLMEGSAVVGLLLGQREQEHHGGLRESSGVLQGALLGFMGLLLAFGLSLALGRYEARRAAVVDDANTIGTTYLRAQTLSEPMRSRSLRLLVKYADVELRLTDEEPGGDAADAIIAEGSALQRRLWASAVRAVREEPTASAPRLYEESLNTMIDQQTVRVTGLSNRVPTEVLLLELIGSAIAMFLVGLHVGLLGRGLTPLLLAAGLVAFLLFVTFDLDRPTRGFIEIPDTPLTDLRASMDEPPVAGASQRESAHSEALPVASHAP
ncbi:bestrophin-like domain [Nocardioides sp. MAHUQ-72]|uniref:bestrophin-like domain n=1 Tax=unclassified Nocardioides TaxID=2615069 RepID=UPI0036121D8A